MTAPLNETTPNSRRASKSAAAAAASATSSQLDAGRLPEAPAALPIRRESAHVDISACPQQVERFQLSPRRWTTLIGVCVFGFCNGVTNETNSILHVYTHVLGLTISEYIYVSQLFFFVPFVSSSLAAGLVDRWGSKLAIFTALLMSTLRNSARALLFSPHVPGWNHLRLPYWVMQRIFTQATVSLYYCLPLKLAEGWFAEEERSLALTMMMVMPVLGQASAALAYPRFVLDVESVQPLAWINLVAAGMSLLFVSLNFRRSKPREGAPSARNQKNLDKLSAQNGAQEPLTRRLSRLVGNRPYLVHMISMSVFDPLVWTINSVLQDIFSTAGLSAVFCGQYLAVSTMMGVLMQITCSLLWKAKQRRQQKQKAAGWDPRENSNKKQSRQEDLLKAKDPYKTRKCKLLLTIQCAAFLVYSQSLVLHEVYESNWLISNQWWLLLSTSVVYILVRYWSAPYYMEQSAELICGSISEPTAGAFQMIVSSLLSNLFAVVFVCLRQVLVVEIVGLSSSDLAVKHHERIVYKYSVLFECAIALAATLFYLIKFKPVQQQQDVVVRLTTNSATITATQAATSTATASNSQIKYSTKL